MRRLLILIIVAAAGLIPIGPDVARTQIGYPYNAWLYLYHPTGLSIATKAQLACGWHSNCDGIFGDANPAGLDWQWANGSTEVWVRNTIFLIGGPTTDTYVARMQTTNVTGSCPKRLSDILRTTDWAKYGTIRQAHALGGGDQYKMTLPRFSGQFVSWTIMP